MDLCEVYLSIFIAAFLPLRYLNGDVLMNLKVIEGSEMVPDMV